MAVTFAKLEARQDATDQLTSFSMASLKRRYFNQHLIDRILTTLAEGTTLDKSSPAYESLCNYGTITELYFRIFRVLEGLGRVGLEKKRESEISHLLDGVQQGGVRWIPTFP
jgi:IS5 family transposase